MSRAAILKEIETARANHAVEGATDDRENSPYHWVNWIARAATGWHPEGWTMQYSHHAQFRACMVKVAALAVAAIESHDRMQRDTRAMR